ncbi:uncharacterized protein LOC118477277 [Aplysia californica]|uniref:Uncharacterized protein LOC118477277 n=1 Tax=Aplysia californica TaxID=6500 RepID=A0ABM1VPE3_APLCA|nr:uncharacterized protein LOC118477277 [Aplysia californica]
MAKPIEEQSGITRDNNVGREDSQYEDVDLDMSLQDNSTLGHREESLYVDVDSDHISSQDIHTPVLIGKTMAEIITPDATLTDGDGRHYNNVLVTSPVSRAGPGGQGHSHNPGTYDVIADPAREAFAPDEMDGPSSSLQNDSTGKGTYVDKGKNKKARASPYANVNDDNKEKPRTSPYANVNNDNVSGSVWFQKKKR